EPRRARLAVPAQAARRALAPRAPRLAGRTPIAAICQPVQMGFRRDGSRRDTSRRHLTLTPSLRPQDMAIDLGTANTLVYVCCQGIVISVPSLVAAATETGEVHAVGA